MTSLPRARSAATRLASRSLSLARTVAPRVGAPREGVAGHGPAPAGTAALRRQRDEARSALRTLRVWRDLVATRLGTTASVADPPQHRRETLAALRLLEADATLVRAVRAGRPVDEACLDTVRALLAADEHVRARSFAQSLLEQPATRAAGLAGVALVARFQSLWDLARDRFAEVPEDLARRAAAVEYLDVVHRGDPDRGAALADAWWDGLSPGARMAVVRFTVRSGDDDRAGTLLERTVADGTRDRLEERDRDEHDWLLAWRSRRDTARAAEARAPRAPVTVAVMGYEQPDLLRQSSNLGDHVQTLGSLGHLLAFPVPLEGDPELVEVLEELRARLRPERRHTGTEDLRGARVVVANRDATHDDALPAGTWLVAFGWFMHSTFGGPYAFPPDDRIRPVYVSFHVQRRAMLTPEAVEHLKEHGPVGCRDWTTTYLLLALGVDAFFSGCLTTTVDAFFPDRAEAPAHGRRAYVDVPVPAADPGGHPFTHADAGVSRASLATNLREAVRRVDEYRGFSAVTTSRLHCYLPATAVGCSVDFTPRRLSDVRFDGLLGLRPGSPELRAMQDGLRDLLEPLYRSILSGAEPETVRTLWRRLTADRVAAARARLSAPVTSLTSAVDVDAAAALVLADRRVHGAEATAGAADVVHVALAADRNLVAEVPVVVESLVGGTARPLHVSLLTRGWVEADHAALARTFPGTTFTVLPCDRVDVGEVAGMLRHITVSTMDRLLLPLLLPDLDRVVYHDVDALTTGDIGELYDTDLGGHALAARSARASWAESGFATVYRASARLPHAAAFEMRRRMFRELPYDFVAFNAGVLVLDLQRMRADDFCRRYLPFAEHYGMNDQEILNTYVGPHRTVLDPRWNAVPQQETVRDPRIVHWAGPAKPWSTDHVVLQELWDRHAERVATRAAAQGVVLPTRDGLAR
ncbi:hypothetical protein KC207_02065 [Phycicoccus sp. BSK3Z-2]|uniref:Glycosyltransferase family 8 protein n=1 Tax=Phycicoccus avicenniae TaxID=2828860 RepID=A0A941D4R8_9MICO|nr:glycosyltransferase [Phycicoccus avicenniae]MBR7742079.1 hypothetical protein [Phycicoccus avicenniae]